MKSILRKLVRIGEWRFRVIGVIAPRGMSIGMDLDEVVGPVSVLTIYTAPGNHATSAPAHKHHSLARTRDTIPAWPLTPAGSSRDVCTT